MAIRTTEKTPEVTGAAEESKAPVTFSKARILTHGKYRARRDLLSVLLTDGAAYTLEDVDAAIGNFVEGKGE